MENRSRDRALGMEEEGDWFGEKGRNGILGDKWVCYFQSDHSGLKSVTIGIRSGG
jgi:hypothetical protein